MKARLAGICAGIVVPLVLWGQSMNTALDVSTLTGSGHVPSSETAQAAAPSSPPANPAVPAPAPAPAPAPSGLASADAPAAASTAASSSPPAPAPADTSSPSSTAPATDSGTNAAPAAPSAPSDSDDEEIASESEFIENGEPCAKPLYVDGHVWIRQPGQFVFHRLMEDEPIQLHAALYTGYDGTLDFAPGPGLAVRMIPGTAMTVDDLPAPQPPTPAAPESAQIDLKKGTVFSALGRPDGQPIDFQVRTPQGVAGARGTMFSTTTGNGQSQVDMLHGTVQFETPDHQKSSITAGQSQQINAGSGGHFTMGQTRPMSAHSTAFFDHAGGLLEHASGAGVVRRSLGPDVARTLQQKGYKLPGHAAERLNHAAKVQTRRPASFHHTGMHAGTPAANHGERATHADKATHAEGETHADKASHPEAETHTDKATHSEGTTAEHPKTTSTSSSSATHERPSSTWRERQNKAAQNKNSTTPKRTWGGGAGGRWKNFPGP
jgi:hypothetical protein